MVGVYVKLGRLNFYERCENDSTCTVWCYTVCSLWQRTFYTLTSVIFICKIPLLLALFCLSFSSVLSLLKPKISLNWFSFHSTSSNSLKCDFDYSISMSLYIKYEHIQTQFLVKHTQLDRGIYNHTHRDHQRRRSIVRTFCIYCILIYAQKVD